MKKSQSLPSPAALKMQLLRQFLLLPLFSALALSEGNSIEFTVCDDTDAVPVLESSSNSLTFLITTNPEAFTRNFFVYYYFFSRTENCGGQLTGPNGTFSSPNYPAPYPQFRYCVWHIQAPKNSKIDLQFQDFLHYFVKQRKKCFLTFRTSLNSQTLYLHWILYPVQPKLSALRFPCNDFFCVCSLELDRNCQLDFTAVYDGPTTNSGLLGKVCGLAQPTFESSSNTMTVVLSTDDTNSYRGFSAHYSSVSLPGPMEPNTTLTCSSDSMRIVLSKSYLASLSFREADLQLNDPSCRPVVTDSVIFSFPLASCGTIKKDEGHSITYTNTISLAPAGNAIITRQRNSEIIAQCRMKNNETLEVIYTTTNNAIQNLAARGRYNVSMAFYESDLFSKPIQYSPYYVDLNQTLFAEVTLHSTDPNLQVFIDTCTASPQPDFGSLTYDLIRSGCNKDDTVVTYPAFGNHGRFKFRAFRFLRSFPSVYLQCDIVICDSNNTNSRCARGCISRQKRAISPYTWKTNTVVGPIRLKRDLRAAEHSESLTEVKAEKTPNLQQYNFYTLAFVVLISNILIVVAVTLKHRKHQRGKREKIKKSLH
ncbi:hypothetical protein IHE44_0001412 [Lamprotornis superbus]|uniref:CUB and zona pellucida-like domain-containing protein 1 n=1 Tax=Lamprotornis superbus TaxID=245042 RepID=A0A835TUI0_9PASS|nr:hypothetical protein IHE44_0001412 [Lamprotornis superbus]